MTSLPRVLILAIHGTRKVTGAQVERIASKRGYIVANARPLSPDASVRYMDGRLMETGENIQLWISEIVVAEYDGQESA